MSTILDALRKVEKDQQTRTADARTRLLSFPARPYSRPPRRQRTLLFVSTGVMLAGLVAGAELMGWGPRFRSLELAEKRVGGDVVSPPADTQLASPSTPTVVVSAPPVAEVEDPPLAELESRFAVDPAIPSPSPFAPPTPAINNQPPAPLAPGDAPMQKFALGKEKRAFSGGTQGEQPLPLPSAMQAARDLLAQATPGDTSAVPPSLPSAMQAARDLLAQATRDLSAVSELAPSPAPAMPEVRPVDITPAPAVAVPAPSVVGSNPVPANTSLSFLQWSPVPAERLAFIKVSGGPLTLAHEGDSVGGFTIVEIRPDSVDLRSGETNFTLQVR